VIAGEDQRTAGAWQPFTADYAEAKLPTEQREEQQLEQPAEGEKRRPVDSRRHARKESANLWPFSKRSRGASDSAPLRCRLWRRSRKLRG
jgi:hypothetical protein